MHHQENATSTHGVFSLGAPLRWLVDNVAPEDHLELAVTGSLARQDPVYLISADVALSSGWGSCSNSHLVGFQRVSTLRHNDLFRENILGNVATTELSLISFPFAERET